MTTMLSMLHGKQVSSTLNLSILNPLPKGLKGLVMHSYMTRSLEELACEAGKILFPLPPLKMLIKF